MIVREANFDDLKSIYKLINELEASKMDFEKFSNKYKSLIEDTNNHCYVAVDNEKVIGLINFKINFQLHHEDKVATIEEFIVSNEYRNLGIGRQLLELAISISKEESCEIIELTSNFTREKAHRFYIKNEFEKTSYKFIRKLK